MADTQKQDEQTPIPYWGYFGQMRQGGMSALEYDPDSSPPAQQFLEALRKYDPFATWVPVSRWSGDQSWQLSVNPSKLPGGGFPGVDLNPSAFDPMYWDPVSSPGENWQQYETWGGASGRGNNLQGKPKDPSQVQTSPVWGTWTPRENWESPDSGDALFRMLGLGGVGLFGFGAPYLASAMSGGAIGGGAGAAGAAGGGTFQIPGGAAGMFGPGSAGIAPSTEAIMGSGSSGLFDIGGLAGDVLAGAPLPSAGFGPSPVAMGGGTSQAAIPSLDTGSDYYLGLEPGAPFQGVNPPSLLDRARAFMNDLGLGNLSKLPPGLTSGLMGGPSGGIGGGGGASRGGGGGAIASEDALAILARYWGVPQETAKRIAQAAQQEGQRNG